MTEQYRYAAFVSYSSKDAPFAKRLHRALEQYGIPTSLGRFDLLGGGKSKNRVYPVFRDREELPAGEIGARIQSALRDSRALIVVCSPHAAESPWVQNEIESFVKLGRQDRIFALIADNAPVTDPMGADATESCFPPAFRGDALEGAKLEPLAADARPGKDGFRNAWLKLVAGLIGVTPGQLIDRDRRRRRTQVIQWAAASAAAIAILALAWQQRPMLDALATSWFKYRNFVHSDEEVLALAPGRTFQDCELHSADCPVMVVLPEGRSMMGSLPEDSDVRTDELPLHEVSIGKFAVSRSEITFANWEACRQGGGCHGYQPNEQGWPGDHPVINVSWDNAQEYVRWLSRMTGEHYRLLAEAEWEYAARAVTTTDAVHTRYSWGDAPPVCERDAHNGAMWGDCGAGNIATSVCSFRRNAFGLCDMHGNVWEWVQDCYRRNYENTTEDTIDPGDCTRVFRGGSWYTHYRHLRSAARFTYGDENASAIDLGFRVARTLGDD